MTKEERFEEALRIFKLCDAAGNIAGSYSADEESSFEYSMDGLVKGDPKLWAYKGWNIQQCYSNMYSKIIVAYLLKEIKNGNILDKKFLDEVCESELDVFNEFRYDDCGFKTTKVLGKILEEILQRDGIFDFEAMELNLNDVALYRADDEYGKARQAFRTSVIQEYPILREYIEDVDEDDEDDYMFYDLTTYPENYYDFEAELVVVHSDVIYEIMEHEKRAGFTELGAKIVNGAKNFMDNLLQTDMLYEDYKWEVFDHKQEKVHYCMITCSQVLGDGYTFYMMNTERLHKYHYVSIFYYLQLLEDIKLYREKYLC